MHHKFYLHSQSRIGIQEMRLLRKNPESMQDKDPSAGSTDQNKVPDKRENSQNTSDKGFEHVAQESLLRKKILIQKPYTYYLTNSGEKKTSEKVPAILHVLQQDEAWMMVGNSQGEAIGKVLKQEIVATPWNTRLVLRPNEKCTLYPSPEDAVLWQNQITFDMSKNIVFPILDFDKGKDGNFYYKVGSPLGVPFQFNDFPAWLPIRNPEKDLTAEQGALISENEMARMRSQLELIILNYQKKVEPDERGDMNILSHACNTLGWKSVAGEWGRTMSPDDYKKTQEKGSQVLVTNAMKISARSLASRDGEAFKTFLENLERAKNYFDVHILALQKSSQWENALQKSFPHPLRQQEIKEVLTCPVHRFADGNGETQVYSFIPLTELP